jgi:hypothetical protein
MKALNVMMAKELLDLQIEQFALMQEELALDKRRLNIELSLGLVTKKQYDNNMRTNEIKRRIYRNLIEDFQMSQLSIAKLEQKQAEEMQELEELDKEITSDIPKEEEQVQDTTYEVVEEEEKSVIDNGAKPNELMKFKATKQAGSPGLVP